MTNLEICHKIAEEVSKRSGTAYYVGGYVRDLIRGVENKDIDIEIHGITPKCLEEILDSIGERIEIGESFGIYSLKGYDIDIALPRKEHLRGVGHRDFDVFTDPDIGTYQASKRRDFTINALMQNVLTGEIVDHFNGLSDLKNKIIRHIDDKTFIEDPLRVLRSAQFASRFDFHVADETLELCRGISLVHLSKERVMAELQKALLKSQRPSLFFNTLNKMGKLGEWFKEVEDLIDVKQSPKYHPEGDVYTHTMITLDYAVNYREKAKNPLYFMLLCLCHDMGKPVSTEEINGEIHSYRHEIKGIEIIRGFLTRLTGEKALIQYVLNMTEHHMKPFILAVDKSSVKATNKMFFSCTEPLEIIMFSMCDNCLKSDTVEYEHAKTFLLQRLEIFNEYVQRPYVTGDDLVNCGIIPDKNFKTLLKYSHKLRLAGVNKETALKETLKLYETIDKNQQ